MSKDFIAEAVECATRGVVRRDPGPYQKTAHEYGLQGPDDWHPAFYGCWDWHSAVHSHFLLARCLRTTNLSQLSVLHRQEAWRILEDHLTTERIAVEVQSLEKEKDGWEVPYGMAWMLRLAEEVTCLNEAVDACPELVQRMVRALCPLEIAAKSRLNVWLKKLKQSGEPPDRKARHSSAAFAMRLMLSHARSGRTSAEVGVKEEAEISDALDVFHSFSTHMPPLVSEGHPFLSPPLVEAQLVVSTGCRHPLLIQDWTEVLRLRPVTGDPHDMQTCHALGLNFSRAEALADLAVHHVTIGCRPMAEKLLALACTHFEASLPYINSGGWMADHWICTFGLMAFESIKLAKAFEEQEEGRDGLTANPSADDVEHDEKHANGSGLRGSESSLHDEPSSKRRELDGSPMQS